MKKGGCKVCFAMVIFVVLCNSVIKAENSDYPYPYNLYEKRQIHKNWIDLNDNGKMDDYENPELPVEKRVHDLLSKMTLEEKASQTGPTNTPPVKRLGIPGYRWWQEASHGLANYGRCKDVTVFPQKIALAATWDRNLLNKIYSAVSDEARARFHSGKLWGDPSLNFYSPSVVGVMRDTRWQRVEESFGEDPYLVSRLAVVTFRAFQGEDDEIKYRKAAGTAKHYVSNKGPYGRDHPSTQKKGPVSERLTREISFPPYKASIQEGNVASVMSAYSRRPTGLSPALVPCSFSKPLLTGVLRDEWGFKGHVTSDCHALEWSMGLFNAPAITKTKEGAAAAALKAGLSINCGDTCNRSNVMKALNKGLIDENDLDEAVGRLLKSRFELGLFDHPDLVPYSKITEKVVASKEHTRLALQAARESIVLLKNENDLLPLNVDKLKRIAVMGPSADTAHLGGYSGTSPYRVSTLEGIRKKVGSSVKVDAIVGEITEATFKKAKDTAEQSDAVVVVIGPPKEGEGSTRKDLSMPESQLELIKAVSETGKPVIGVILGGSPVSSDWMKENVPAILEAWYPGMEGGNAIADVVFGDYNPSGKLPITYPRLGCEPVYYNHKGEICYDETTYLWHFGYGLSYTEFKYSNIKVSPPALSEGNITVSFDVENTGKREGDAVPQLYLSDVAACVETPVKQLKGFDRITLKPGEKKTVEFIIPFEELSLLDEELNRIVEPGKFEVMIGKSSEDIVLRDCFIVNKMTKLKGCPKYNCKKFTLENESGKSNSPFTVKANQPFMIKAVVENSGEITGWTELKAYDNGGVIQKRKIGLCPGEEKSVIFEVSLFTPGKHKIAVENVSPQTVIVNERKPEFSFGKVSVTADNYPEPVEISTIVINKGSAEGREKVSLKVNGKKAKSKKVTVPAAPGGGAAEVSFKHDFKKAGIYTIQVGNPPTTEIILPDIQLTGDWKFHKADNPVWKEPDFDDSEWQSVELPDNWENHSGYSEDNVYGWYRRKIHIPEGWKGHTLEINLGKIDDVDECFFNGEKIGQTGEFPRNEDYYTMVGRRQELRKYTIPEKLIRYGEDNTIAVRVFDGSGAGGMYSDIGGIKPVNK